jgi:phosphatidylserine/phosphatidylglycerophosphate/cardiolipin synthase-like enzyme
MQVIAAKRTFLPPAYPALPKINRVDQSIDVFETGDVKPRPLSPELTSDGSKAVQLKRVGTLTPQIDQALAEGIAKVLRIRSDGFSKPEDEHYDFTPVTHSGVKLLIDEKVYYDGLYKAVSNAKQFIHVINFVTETEGILADHFFGALKNKAEQGVDVAMVVDDLGSGTVLPCSRGLVHLERLREAGIQVVNNRWLWNGVEHRKILVADDGKGGIVAYLGGFCLTKESVAPLGKCQQDVEARRCGEKPPQLDTKERATFHDAMVELHGDGARQIQVMTLLSFMHRGFKFPQLADREFVYRYFGKDWSQGVECHAGKFSVELGQTLPFGRNKLREWAYAALDEAIASKKAKSVDVQFAYLTDPLFVDKLCALAQGDEKTGRSKTRVRLLVPGHVFKNCAADSKAAYFALRDMYPRLLQASVEVREFNRYNHAKVVSIKYDDVGDAKTSRKFSDTVIFSTGNLDPTSLKFGRDATLRFRNAAELGAQADVMFEEDFKPTNSHRVTLAEVEKYEDGNVWYYFGKFSRWLASWF